MLASVGACLERRRLSSPTGHLCLQLDAKNKQLEEDVGNLASDAQGVSSRIEGAVASMNEVRQPPSSLVQLH